MRYTIYRDVLTLILPLYLLMGCSPINYLCNYTLKDQPRYACLDTCPAPQTGRKVPLKVVSYNIKHGKKAEKALALLKENGLASADIILAQELTPRAVQKIAETLNLNYVYYPAILHPVLKQDFGNAIFSRWPIEDDEKIILPHIKSPSRQRIAVKATLRVNGEKVVAYSLHMGIFIKPDDRKRLVEIILKPLDPDTRYCIIGGDFNSFTRKDRAQISRAFRERGFEQASKGIGWTYNQWYLLNRKVPLDHIFTKNMQTVRSGKIDNRRPSDHLPIWVDLRFKKD